MNTQVEIYDQTPVGRILVQQFTTHARSIVKPGVAEAGAGGAVALGASAALGTSAEFLETAKAPQ